MLDKVVAPVTARVPLAVTLVAAMVVESVMPSVVVAPSTSRAPVMLTAPAKLLALSAVTANAPSVVLMLT